MNTYTQIQAPRVLQRPQSRQTMAAFIASAVRKEMLVLSNAPKDVVDDEERLLQQRWYDLRKWAYPLGALGLKVRRRVVHALQGLAIDKSREYPEVSRSKKTIAIHRILSAGFPGLFTNPDPAPEG